MRIALLQPAYWPEVRRGTERVVHDLGTQLADRGHDVTLITSHPAPPSVALEDGITVARARRPRPRRPLRHYEDHLDSTPGMVWRLLRGRYDLAHAFQPAYAWAAVQARRLGGPPVVFSFHGIPERRYLVGRRYRLEMLKTTIGGVASTTVLSEAAAGPFRRYLLVDPVVLPGGVFCDEFAVEAPKAGAPTVVCAASLGDPRKRADLLFSAFQALRERRPDARLLLVRTPDPHLSPLEVTPPRGAEWVEAERTEDLARAYASAWASVLPGTGEAFGLVMVESLAAGTPVVAARAGACPEIVHGDRIGRLFEPGDEGGLEQAMDRVLDLGQPTEIAEACRERASEFDWRRVIGGYERLYESVLGGRGAAA
jgi:phosphatidylinositol alpha-mannosyltransferase